METSLGLIVLYSMAAAVVLRKIQVRLRLSRAKHPSLRGHSKLSRRVAKFVPFYEYDEQQFFSSDGAPQAVAVSRRRGFELLKQQFARKSPKSIAMSEQLESTVSDVMFTNAYRVPFQYRNYVRNHLKLGSIVDASAGTQLRDIDGNWSYDLSGSYGVNIFGYDFYKACLDRSGQGIRPGIRAVSPADSGERAEAGGDLRTG